MENRYKCEWCGKPLSSKAHLEKCQGAISPIVVFNKEKIRRLFGKDRITPPSPSRTKKPGWKLRAPSKARARTPVRG